MGAIPATAVDGLVMVGDQRRAVIPLRALAAAIRRPAATVAVLPTVVVDRTAADPTEAGTAGIANDIASFS